MVDTPSVTIHFYLFFIRSKNIESAATNGDMAFQEVRIQQSVIEFILNHSDQIFSCGSVQLKPREGRTVNHPYGRESPSDGATEGCISFITF